MDRKEIRKQVTKSVTTETRDEIKRAWQKLGIVVVSIFGVLVFLLLVVLLQRGLATRGEELPDEVEEAPSVEILGERAREAARGFLAAETVPAKARFVAEPRRVMPLMEHYYQTHPREDREFRDLVDRRYHVAGGRKFLMGHVVFEDETRDFWVFEKNEKGEVKLQWEALTAYSEKDWESFIDSRDMEGGTFRVLLEVVEDPYFNYDFAEPELYTCLLLRVPQSERYLYGYLDRSSEVHDSFVAVRFMSELIAMPVIAKLRFPDGAHGEQVHIDDIENFSWIHGVDM